MTNQIAMFHLAIVYAFFATLRAHARRVKAIDLVHIFVNQFVSQSASQSSEKF